LVWLTDATGGLRKIIVVFSWKYFYRDVLEQLEYFKKNKTWNDFSYFTTSVCAGAIRAGNTMFCYVREGRKDKQAGFRKGENKHLTLGPTKQCRYPVCAK